MHVRDLIAVSLLLVGASACTSPSGGAEPATEPGHEPPPVHSAQIQPASIHPVSIHPTVELLIALPLAHAAEAPYTLKIVNLQQRPWNADGLGLQVQTEFEPQGAAELIKLHPRITHCVTEDGVEHAQPDPPYMSAMYPTAGMAGTVVIGTEHSRLRLLEIACTVLEIEERVDRIATDIHIGRTDSLELGSCRVTVTGEPSLCWIATSAIVRDTADATRRLPVYGHDWSNDRLRVTDANGARLVSTGGGGSGGTTALMYVHPKAMSGGAVETAPEIAYPLTIVFPEPVRVTERPVTFRWEDIPLPPLNDGR